MGSDADVVRELLSLFDLAALRDQVTLGRLLHADVEIDLSDRVLNPDVYRGFDGVRRLSVEVAEVWIEYRLQAEELFERDGRVVAFVRATGRGRASGVEVDGHPAVQATVRDGKVASFAVVGDRAAALRWAGVEQ